jgi:predicted NACHT family NTPase
MAYVKKVHDGPIAEQIQEFIYSHWLIQGLVRIPIQLDALCYSWNHDFHADGGPKNMTTLYEAIKLKLWKKDILRLEKFYSRKLLTKATVSRLTMEESEWLVQDEINLLESLAFSGLYNNIIDFDINQRGQIKKKFLPSERMILSEDVLAKLSFLRTSDSALKEEEKSYHFLHLTFQEFFCSQLFCTTVDI